MKKLILIALLLNLVFDTFGQGQQGNGKWLNFCADGKNCAPYAYSAEAGDTTWMSRCSDGEIIIVQKSLETGKVSIIRSFNRPLTVLPPKRPEIKKQ